MKIKGIFLIISSNDNGIYNEFKNLHRVYLKNYRPLFRYFLLNLGKNRKK